jgi:hypothetical protein
MEQEQHTANERKKFEADVVYKSKGVTPMGHPFLTVKRARGYYEYSERGGVDSVAFILYDSDTTKFALIYESKPPRDEIEQMEVNMTTAFGGSIDMAENMSYKEICQIEIREESGYIIPLTKIHSVGKTMVSTQMSQMVEGFLVDVTGIQKTEKTEDEHETSEFKTNKVLWLDADDLMDNNDWKSIWIFTQAVYKKIV